MPGLFGSIRWKLDEAYKVPGFLPGKDDFVIDIGANVGDSALWW